ncbi:MAG TPA: S-adenosylmethionine decarboxylase [Candidatus Babeliales bacterium]|nr:S-adenosylmethionine decarboxylase [Candidatus Babeliales bacterium]
MKLNKNLIASGLLTLCLAPIHAESINCTGKTAKAIEQINQTFKAFAQETSIELAHCNPESIRRSADEMKLFIQKLAAALHLKPFSQPHLVHFSDNKAMAGYQFVLMSEQGSISGRFVNQTNSALFTIFCCNPYNAYAVAEIISQDFGGTPSIDIKLRK